MCSFSSRALPARPRSARPRQGMDRSAAWRGWIRGCSNSHFGVCRRHHRSESRRILASFPSGLWESARRRGTTAPPTIREHRRSRGDGGSGGLGLARPPGALRRQAFDREGRAGCLARRCPIHRASVPDVHSRSPVRVATVTPAAPRPHCLGSSADSQTSSRSTGGRCHRCSSVWPEPFSRESWRRCASGVRWSRRSGRDGRGGRGRRDRIAGPAGRSGGHWRTAFQAAPDPDRRERWARPHGERAREVSSTRSASSMRCSTSCIAPPPSGGRPSGSGVMSRSLAYYLGVSPAEARGRRPRGASANFSGRVLDVGGASADAAPSAPRGARWVVADLDRARRRWRAHVGADVQALPFRTAPSMPIKATELLEHVPDVARALAECRRVLRPGAHLVITVPFSSACTAIRMTMPATPAACGSACSPRPARRAHDDQAATSRIWRACCASWCARPAALRYATFPLLDGLTALNQLSARVRARPWAA